MAKMSMWLMVLNWRDERINPSIYVDPIKGLKFLFQKYE